MDWNKAYNLISQLLNNKKAEVDEHMKESSRVDSECVSEPKCTPDTCWGECQGMGWCSTATEFRNAIIPKINNKPHPVGCKCKKCTMGNHLIFKQENDIMVSYTVFLIYLWTLYGCIIGIVKKVKPESVPDYPLWNVFLNGPLWWWTYLIFKIKRIQI